MTEEQIIKSILVELHLAERLYPTWPADPVHAAAIVTEEAGEALQAANNARWHGGPMSAMEAELVQTGAMAVRALKNLRNFGGFWG